MQTTQPKKKGGVIKTF